MLEDRRVDHEEGAIAEAISTLVAIGADIVLVSGASAVVDRRDVAPAAIERAGGRIEHFGMPVDPGNLLLLRRHRGAGTAGFRRRDARLRTLAETQRF